MPRKNWYLVTARDSNTGERVLRWPFRALNWPAAERAAKRFLGLRGVRDFYLTAGEPIPSPLHIGRSPQV
jgi:hypothetical protein